MWSKGLCLIQNNAYDANSTFFGVLPHGALAGRDLVSGAVALA
jgi:hypothetical protein